MITLGNMAAMIIVLGVSFYTASYGMWTWKNKNKYGAVWVFALVLITVILPVYSLFIRE